MDLTQILTQTVSKQLSQGVSKKLGLPQDQSQNVVNMALPVILGGLAKNAQDPQNAAVLSQTLKKHHSKSTVLNDIPNDAVNETTLADGAKILGHIFGQNTGTVADTISTQTQVQPNQVAQILSMAAPLVLAALAKKQQADNMTPEDLAGTLQQTASEQTAQAPQHENIITQLLDQNHDGSVVDDVVGMGARALGNLFKK